MTSEPQIASPWRFFEPSPRKIILSLSYILPRNACDPVMKKCREYRIRVSSFPATYASLSYAWNWRFSLPLPFVPSTYPFSSSSSSSSFMFVHTYTNARKHRLESKPSPLLFQRLVHVFSSSFAPSSGKERRGSEKVWEGRVPSRCFRVNAALGLTTRPAGYTCGRLPYLLRPSNKPQTSSRGKGWRGKERLPGDTLSLVNGWGSFRRLGEGEFCANFVSYGIAAASQGVCMHLRAHVRSFLVFDVTITGERGRGGRRRGRIDVSKWISDLCHGQTGTLEQSISLQRSIRKMKFQACPR